MGESHAVIAPNRIGDFIFKGTIGEGAFSIVKLVVKEQNGQYYACKIIPRAKLEGSIRTRFELEIRINQQMRHPGVVALIDLFKDDFNYYIIMEFCPNGELFEYIVQHGKLSERECKPLFYQLTSTIQFIHNMNVCHRDLKPENILIDRFGRLKISDFGLSRFMGPNCIVSTSCGSPCYASPECISGKPYNAKTSDVWSLGVIFYAMSSGLLPWTKRNQTELYQQISTGDYKIPNHLSPALADLVRKMLTVDLNKRITIAQILDHDFFKDINKQVVYPPLNVPLVSLKKIDQFFERDKEEQYRKDHPDEFSSSTGDNSFRKQLDQLSEKKHYLIKQRNILYAMKGEHQPKVHEVTEADKQNALKEIHEICNKNKTVNTIKVVDTTNSRKPVPKTSLVNRGHGAKQPTPNKVIVKPGISVGSASRL
ncbi:CAMK family protein kinase [Trichomonas vaginalis G3]|uniref:CAMK family protein kinase n=1 Tax=Trichomonas vaginalis (strain ATCC PRA-98 / G3) TaxID=412133 RepID=A2ET53_TRIV3|nr:protein serine/threonine kinase protein [Trichomonas vaginalis G3]EAY04169.1 CAMK family protein kinase [Trichomonas vaginalis G3]KAI5514839.1 protein serine/threonine kinase protein [Trichomonas vaginalis G3]|eukprot:XP_001316392.1 CAMK family protein kinase [Trichomonas vaginalis G3]